MKKKKILNIRNSLITGALILTTTLTGCGLFTSNRNSQKEEPNSSASSSSSQVIIDNNENNNNTLPGGVVIDPNITEPEGPSITDPIDTNKPNISQGNEEQKPEVSTEQSKPTQGNANQGSTTNEPQEPTIVNPPIVHQHTLGEWVAIDDLLEGTYCPEDGALVLTRVHDYKITDIKTLDTLDGFSHDTTITEACATCGHEKSTTYSREGHSYGEKTWDETYEYETCESCGHVHTIGKHKFDNGKIKGNEKIYSCTNEDCGYSFAKPYTPSHNNGGGSHSGGGNHGGGGSSTDTPSHTHNWSAWTPINDTEHRRTCTVDGCTIKTETSSHTFGDWSEWSEWALTTDAEGKQIEVSTRTQNCNDCGYVKSEKQTRPYTPSHTHNWSAWTVTKAPTCTESGIETRTCSADGCTVITETRTISSLGHSYGEWIVIENWHVVTKPDGTKVEQRTLEQTCSVCGNKNTKTEEKPYTPGHTHSWSEWEITKQPTCTEDGEKTRTCLTSGCPVRTETEVITALGHTYSESTRLVSNNDGTHDVVKTKTCSVCGDIQTETISSGISCTYNNIEEVKNADNVVIQEIHSCDCGDSYTVSIDPKPEHTTHTPDDHGQYRRKPDDCCYETYYICGECGVEYGNKKVGHNPGEPDEFGVIKCTECRNVIGQVEPELPGLPTLPNLDEDKELDSIIENQDKAQAEANATADQQLDELLNSGASETEMDTALDEIIKEQEQTIADANATADQQLDETIANVENAKVEEIIASQDSVIEEAKKVAEAKLEEVLSSDADDMSKDAAIDRIIEETDRAIGEAAAQAEADLAALLGIVPTTPTVRILAK